jgi:hypothetical protein
MSSQHVRHPLSGENAQFVFGINMRDIGRWATLPPDHVILLPEPLSLAQSLFFFAEPRAAPALQLHDTVRGVRGSMGHVMWNGLHMMFIAYRPHVM